MKKLFAAVLFLTTLWSGALAAETVLKTGYEPGKPTMDFDAALRWAQKNHRPVFVDFTGSDWCYWCQLMQAQVFTKAEWDGWARGQVAYVTIDFPEDKTLVPPAFRKRNQELAARFAIEGYPTYVILDADGVTELGRLGAGQDKTPRSFIAEVRGVTRFSRAGLKALAAQLTAPQQARLQSALAAWTPTLAEADLDAVKETIVGLQTEYAQGKFTAAEKEAYGAAEKKRDEQQTGLDAWLATKPKNTDENRKKYAALSTAIAAQQAVLDGLVLKYLG